MEKRILHPIEKNKLIEFAYTFEQLRDALIEIGPIRSGFYGKTNPQKVVEIIRKAIETKNPKYRLRDYKEYIQWFGLDKKVKSIIDAQIKIEALSAPKPATVPEKVVFKESKEEIEKCERYISLCPNFDNLLENIDKIGDKKYLTPPFIMSEVKDKIQDLRVNTDPSKTKEKIDNIPEIYGIRKAVIYILRKEELHSRRMVSDPEYAVVNSPGYVRPAHVVVEGRESFDGRKDKIAALAKIDELYDYLNKITYRIRYPEDEHKKIGPWRTYSSKDIVKLIESGEFEKIPSEYNLREVARKLFFQQ